MTTIVKGHSIGQTSKEGKIAALNQMVEQWRAGFHKPPQEQLLFSVNEKDELCLNDIVICNIDDASVEEACSDHEAFFIDSNGIGKYYRIKLIWDFQENFSIDEVSLVLHKK